MADESSPLQVAYVLTRLSPGGSVTLVRNRVESLANLGVNARVILLLPDAPLSESSADFIEWAESRGVALIRVNHRGKHEAVRTLRVLRTHLMPVDIVHSVNSQDIYVPMAGWLSRTVFLRDLVSTEPARTYSSRLAASMASKNVAVSRAVARVSGLPRTVVVYPPTPGLDQGVPPGEPRSGSLRDPSILFVGRLERLKGAHHLVDVAAATRDLLPDARFLVAGDGSYFDSIRRDLASSGLAGAVHLLGFRSDIRELHASADIYLSLSSAEGLAGYGTLEAVQYGTPVVAPHIEAVEEVLRDGSEALLVDPENPEMVASAIAELSSDASLRQRLVATARPRVAELLGPLPTGLALRDLYRTLAIRGGRG